MVPQGCGFVGAWNAPLSLERRVSRFELASAREHGCSARRHRKRARAGRHESSETSLNLVVTRRRPRHGWRQVVPSGMRTSPVYGRDASDQNAAGLGKDRQARLFLFLVCFCEILDVRLTSETILPVFAAASEAGHRVLPGSKRLSLSKGQTRRKARTQSYGPCAAGKNVFGRSTAYGCQATEGVD